MMKLPSWQFVPGAEAMSSAPCDVAIGGPCATQHWQSHHHGDIGIAVIATALPPCVPGQIAVDWVYKRCRASATLTSSSRSELVRYLRILGTNCTYNTSLLSLHTLST
jgi:hypothetical protein